MTNRPSKPEFIALFALLTALTAFSTDAILPALPAIAEAYDATPKGAMLTVTLFVLGMVFGEILFGPLADARGRKVAILSGLAIYAAGALLAMNAVSLEGMIAGRILQGVGVAGPKIGSRAAIRDRFAGAAMAQAMSLIMTVFMFVPMVAPTVGQILLKAAGWEAIFVAYVVVAAVAALWLAVRQPETLAPADRIPLRPAWLAGNAALVLRHPHVLAHTLAAGFMFGAHLHYLSVAQALIGDAYGMGDLFPAIFAVIGLSLAAAFFTNSQLVMRFGMVRLVQLALWTEAAVAVVLILLALVYGGLPPMGLALAGFMAMFFCIGILFGNLNALAMQVLGQVAGLGASVIASVSSLVAVIIALAGGWAFDGTLLPVAATFLMTALASIVVLTALRTPELSPIVPRRS